MEINNIIKTLLSKRGIGSDEDIREFLSPKPGKTYDPLLLPDMEAGADLILQEIRNGSRIMIYGDYDADGITATALMMSVLGHLMKDRPEDLDFYIPSRFGEGYGLNPEAVSLIHDKGFDLIVTVDCGSVSKNEVRFAEELGMKILVTDHHTITDTMAECLLINPKKPGSEYPFKELCGCGVAFKLAQTLQKKAGLPKSILAEVLDLVAIGTIGDIMPLVDENRTLVKYGLRIINQGMRPGLRKLIEGTGLTPGNVSSENVGFVIVPHLNASGRIEDASWAVKLLLSESNDPELNEIVDDIIFKNKERKRIQTETYRACMDLADDQDFMIIRCDDAHEGIAGIVAGKIKDHFYRPTVICMPSKGEEGLLKGTGRSIEGISLYEMLKKHEELFVKFGGHSGACGFTMKEEDFDELKKGLLEDIKAIKEADPEVFTRKIPWDMDIEADDVTQELADALELLSPFGNGNPKPIFRIKDVRLRDVRHMGVDGKHARFTVHEGNRYINCVLFNKAEEYSGMLTDGKKHDIAGSLETQYWQGQKRLQLIVENMID